MLLCVGKGNYGDSKLLRSFQKYLIEPSDYWPILGPLCTRNDI